MIYSKRPKSEHSDFGQDRFGLVFERVKSKQIHSDFVHSVNDWDQTTRSVFGRFH